MALERPHMGHFGGHEVVLVHVVTPRAEMGTAIDAALEEITAALQAQRVEPASAWYAHHHRRPAETFDFDVCFPVSQPVALSGRLEHAAVPEMEVVRTAYHGGYEGLSSAWPEFHTWIKGKGHKVREEFYEVYAVGPREEPAPEAWHTDLIVPVAEPLAGKEAIV